jgi:hypothetical protein
MQQFIFYDIISLDISKVNLPLTQLKEDSD